MDQPITQLELKTKLNYDCATGIFTWAYSRPGAKKYGIAGYSTTRKDGKRYVKIMVNRKLFFAHRLAFLYMTGRFPINEIDHIDGNGLNNAWENLREATRVENLRNRRLSKNNSSGAVGVTWAKNVNKWQAQIQINGKHKFLGHFSDIKDAIQAREIASKKHGFHHNHGTSRSL